MQIADIRIGERHRKDMGDIEELARSIDEIGLLQPIVVEPDGTLIAGERRIRACLMLGWEEIPAKILYAGNKMRNGGESFQISDIGPTCEICGYPFAHIHHALPRQYGGSDDDGNLVALCPNHHAAIHFMLRVDLWLATDEGRAKLDAKPKQEVSMVLARQAFLQGCDPALGKFYRERVVAMMVRQVRDADK